MLITGKELMEENRNLQYQLSKLKAEIKEIHQGYKDLGLSIRREIKVEQRKKVEDLKRFREYVACGDCPVCNGKFTETICWRILDFDQLLDQAFKEEK